MPSIRNLLLCLTALCVTALSLVSPPLFAQDDEDAEDEGSQYRAGLSLKADTDVPVLARHAFMLETPSDALQWNGYLESESEGEYRIAAQFQGELLIEVDNKVLVRASSDKLQWIASEPISLEYAHHPFRISLKRSKTGGSLRLNTYWSGPGFQFEPIPTRHLWHDQDAAHRSSNARGAELVRALRCEACHTLPAGRNALRSPSLKTAGTNLKSDWLTDFLTKKPGAARSSNRVFQAVHGRFDESEARDIATWLQSTRRGTSATPDAASIGDAKAGRVLFMTIGCLACHTHEQAGHSGTFGGGDLTSVATKRPASYFPQWLDDPSSINSNHRMPEFDLTEQEILDLSAFLVGSGNSIAATPGLNGDVDRGRKLAKSNHCARCHDAESFDHDTKKSALSHASDWSDSCLTTLAEGRPNYRLQHRADRVAVETYIRSPPNVAYSGGEMLLAENNCLQCHPRGSSLGLLPVTVNVVEKHTDLVSLVASMKPPSLNSVGDKLVDRVLRHSISRREPPHRPWLSVQMPRFPLSEQQVQRISDFLVAQDRVPDGANQIAGLNTTEDDSAVAERLLTSDGFGCTSCHSVGKMDPPARTPMGQLGPSLSMPQKRLRKVWFERWVRNPARITAKMEMPSVQIPIPGVLGGDLDRQLDAVWNILNTPRFTPPDPAPVRTVRRSGDMSDPAVVLTDVLHFNGRRLIKPFLIGLPNRRNVLLDLSQGRLAGWWTGDTARQRTQGKTWYWESPAIEVRETPSLTEFVLVRGGDTILQPQRVGQFLTQPDEWSQIESGVELKHRLHFPSGGSAELKTVRVRQRFVATDKGWERQLFATGLSRDESLGLRSGFATMASTEKYPRLDDFMVAKANEQGQARLRLRYVSEAVVDRVDLIPPDVRRAADENLPSDGGRNAGTRGFTPRSIGKYSSADRLTRSDPRQLDVMPGFKVTQLPLRNDVMPIALTWRPNGELLVASLKGRVWSAKDTDGDQLEDDMRVISDELAAPYGIFATDDHIDVLCKYGLVRLHDENKDGIADRHELVASGWGHTEDYHDWAVGLPRDEVGNYYVAIPCQQDDRSPASARFRGAVLKLEPREPNFSNPQRFRLQQISGGHRFPMGIARNRMGQLFVTDNQGNYNPFNELNHVVQGARYGFINKLERSDGFNPPLTPPAIDIPHPWTRSVNGICFLETPRHLEGVEPPFYGPFEGHLLGCEYDTRRLIRMSLEEVDGWMQGAAYPLAEAAVDPADGLQGPVNCAIGAGGELYVANIRDSGWGAANNTGSIVRVVPDMKNLPAGIAEISVRQQGFHIRFTRPVDRKPSGEIGNYSISSYRRTSTPAYGGDDLDRRQESVMAATVADDLMSVDLQLEELRTGFVYEFRLKKLISTEARFFPAEGFYTLRRLRK